VDLYHIFPLFDVYHGVKHETCVSLLSGPSIVRALTLLLFGLLQHQSLIGNFLTKFCGDIVDIHFSSLGRELSVSRRNLWNEENSINRSGKRWDRDWW
jgi:hypothetical protein